MNQSKGHKEKLILNYFPVRMDTPSICSIQQCNDPDVMFPSESNPRFIDLLPAPNPLLPYSFRHDPVVSLSPQSPLPDFPEQQKQPGTRTLSFECCDREFFELPQTKSQTLWQHHLENENLCVYMKHELPRTRKHFATAIVPLSNPIKQIEGKCYTNTDWLQFDSCFESGNLFAAYRLSDRQYNLLLQNDINSKGNTQWFFFSVRRAKAGQTVKFNVINLMKNESLYHFLRSAGTKKQLFLVPRRNECAIFSQQHLEKQDHGHHYTLTFSYTFQYDDDCVYFAHSYPYTLTKLYSHITSIMQSPYVQCRKLCQCLGGNSCPQLTITEAGTEAREGIVLQSRQHPGETTGSFVMEGCLEYLTEETFEARFLRQKYVFRCYPMLNPDGVVNGNYRCNLSGTDINRHWAKPRKEYYPIVHSVKQSIKQFNLEHRVKLLLDFHSHSKKQHNLFSCLRFSTFFYGNVDGREFPAQVCGNSSMFSFPNSRFQVRPSQEQTARVALWRTLNHNPKVFTIETSFFGYLAEGTIKPYTMLDLKQIGRLLLHSLFQLQYESLTTQIRPLGVKNCERPLQSLSTKASTKQQTTQQTTQVANECAGEDTDTSMSESDPSDGELTDRSQILRVAPSKKKRKTYFSRSRKSSCSNVMPSITKNRSVSESKNTHKIFVFDRPFKRRSPTRDEQVSHEVSTQTLPYSGKYWLVNETQVSTLPVGELNPKQKKKMVVQGNRLIDTTRTYEQFGTQSIKGVEQSIQTFLTCFPKVACKVSRTNQNSPAGTRSFEKCSLLGAFVQRKNATLLFKARNPKGKMVTPTIVETSFQDVGRANYSFHDILTSEKTSIQSSKYLIKLTARRFSNYAKRSSLDEQIINPLAKRFNALLNR